MEGGIRVSGPEPAAAAAKKEVNPLPYVAWDISASGIDSE